LPVFGAVVVFSDVLMKERGVGNDPGILADGECVVGNHPSIAVSDTDFGFDLRINGNDLVGHSL